MKNFIKWISLITAGVLLLGGCSAATPPEEQEPANRTKGRFPTVGYYAYQGATQKNIDFWVDCGIDTIELLDIGWFYHPERAPFENYYKNLANEISAAQAKGLKVYIVLLTNLEQWKGDADYGNGSGKTFDPADTAMMQQRLSYIEHAIKQCSHADGFSLFAGDPGGVLGMSATGGIEYYVQMGKDVQKLVKQHAPQAEYNLNLWALAQYDQSTANPHTVAFWHGEATHARTLIAMQDLFGPDLGVEIPGHDYYRALALSLYAANNAYPEKNFPTEQDITALHDKQTPRTWAFSHFLLDELDDGDMSGTSRTTLPSFNTRYIYKYIEGIRNTGMNGAIAGNSTLNNAANLYAFARMASDESATPESVLREYAGFVATADTADTLFEIFKFLENDANWHQKVPKQDQLPLFATTIKTPEQALELLKTVKVNPDPDFSLPESAESYLNKIGQRVAMMLPGKSDYKYPNRTLDGKLYLALREYYDVESDPTQGFYQDGKIKLDGNYFAFTSSLSNTFSLSSMRNNGGKFYMNVYASKDTEGSAGYLQFSDTKDKLAIERTYHIDLPALKQGWNRVEVPLSQGHDYASPIENWTRIASYRVVMLGQAGDEYYISDLYFQ